MSVLLLTVGGVLMIAHRNVLAWNSWSGYMHTECSKGMSMSRMMSQFDDRYNDRRYYFDCGRYVGKMDTRRCKWTHKYVNDWGGTFEFMCNHGHILTGVESVQNAEFQDRRFKFLCCPVRRIHLLFCYLTPMINDVGIPIDYELPEDRVLAGFRSWQQDGDRIWQAYVCRYD